MRHQTPIPTPIPYDRRTPVVSVDYDPDRPGCVRVVTAYGSVGSMSIAAFEHSCRPIPGARVLDVVVTG